VTPTGSASAEAPTLLGTVGAVSDARHLVICVVIVLLAVPAAAGAFWVARGTGFAAPVCGDRPGRRYPSNCTLPAPFGSGAPPTTSAFQP